MTVNQIIEVFGALSGITYSLLLMREKKLGWWFGILSSFIGVYLFYQTKIYAHAVISFYYALVGIYGLWYWSKAEKRNEHIHVWSIPQHLKWVLPTTVLSFICAYLFEHYTDSKNPYLDSFLTLFGLLASFKEARKILSSWVYWFILNGLSVWLYYQRELYYYAALMVVYTLICISGYLSWYKIYKTSKELV